MLVLSRKLGEQIQIGENVTITVCRIQGGQVRIGIEAPDEVAIQRAEAPPLAAALDAVLAASAEDLAVDDDADGETNGNGKAVSS